LNTHYDARDTFAQAARSGAALRVWMAALRDGEKSIDPESSRLLQCSMSAILDGLTTVADAVSRTSGGTDLPLHYARDLLGVIDRALWNFQGCERDAAPSSVDLMITADLAGEYLARFISSMSEQTTVPTIPEIGGSTVH